MNIPYMLGLLAFHPLLRRVYEKLRPISVKPKSDYTLNGKAQSDALGLARLNQRVSFDFGFALLFLTALHGTSALKVLTVLYLNYCIATKLPKKYVVAATWVFNISVLFSNELCDGYKYSKIQEFFSKFAGETALEGEKFNATWGRTLDNYSGIMPRWEIPFNITVLRLISFNLDYYWSLDRQAGSPLEVSLASIHTAEPQLSDTNTHKKKNLDPSNLSENDRTRTPAPEGAYNFRNYVAFAIYAPLYIAGPIFTFNDYISQSSYPAATIERSRTLKYGIRFLLTLLCMEVVLHFDYCVAISKAAPNWADYGPKQLVLLSYFNLHILWLKLLIPWRLFRLWALIDGIDAPENMIRCVSNVPSTVAFWRGWHRSFNKWLIRYLYVPLGGSTVGGRFGQVRAVFNYLVVFTFVALWHDINLNLLIWGWLVVFFMLPEIIASRLFPRKNFENNLTLYRWLCAIGAIGNLLMMMAANMVGFAVGLDGLKSMIGAIFSDWGGISFLVTGCCALFVGINMMFEVREEEMRNGIYLKC